VESSYLQVVKGTSTTQQIANRIAPMWIFSCPVPTCHGSRDITYDFTTLAHTNTPNNLRVNGKKFSVVF
jgi:hypothetical protein